MCVPSRNRNVCLSYASDHCVHVYYDEISIIAITDTPFRFYCPISFIASTASASRRVAIRSRLIKLICSLIATAEVYKHMLAY